MNESSKPRRINEFVGLFAVREQRQDVRTNAGNETFRIIDRQIRLHDESCRNVDKLSNLAHSPRLVGELLGGRRAHLLNEPAAD